MPSTPVPAAQTKPVPLWRRFAAIFYDLFPLLGLWIAGAGLWMLVFHRDDSLQQLASATRDPLDRVLRDLWLLALAAAYFVVSWVRVGATVGMRAWKLRLVRDDGMHLDTRTACLRFVLALVSLALIGCGFWYAWFDPGRRTWHDRVCGTRMTRL
ncbi:MAG TPA: RDD family protein [Rhodanobacteraceae bacterium]|nr:RDD family protein [Rhodanobacteraceae bacterium]